MFKAIDTTDESKCCGCMACMNVCQHQAISMIENEKGFIMPFVDINKCVDCGLCLNVCDFRKEHKNDTNNIEHAYSLIANDKETLKESTSGGAFTVLSDIILSNGGIIIGSVMENDFTVRHITTTSSEARNRMRGSKYVQSDVSEIYKETRESLKKGQHVLFSGTPCQCAALRSYLGKDYDNLIVVDFLCHGVPNNKMFKEHIEYLNAYYRIPSVGFSFRNKTYGWDSYNNNNNLSNGKTKIKWINQIYYNFFVSNLSLRPACHRCPYRSLHRPSDITIADFWGIEKLTGHKNRDGVSLVMTHSEKGLELVKKAMENCQVREYPSESVLFRIATAPSKPNAKCDIFWETYIEKGYNGVAKKFFINSRKNRVRFEVRKIAKKLRIG